MKPDIAKLVAHDLVKKIASFEPKVSAKHVGTIVSVADGVARVSGLPNVAYLEELSFPHDVYGFAINLEEDSVGAIILGDYLTLREGDEVRATGKLLSVPVSDALLGRVINPLGQPIDGKGNVPSKTFYPLEKIAPGVV